jgi:hypothetical protein
MNTEWFNGKENGRKGAIFASYEAVHLYVLAGTRESHKKNQNQKSKSRCLD